MLICALIEGAPVVVEGWPVAPLVLGPLVCLLVVVLGLCWLWVGGLERELAERACAAAERRGDGGLGGAAGVEVDPWF